MPDQIFYLFSAVLLGLVVGALIMYFATGSNKDSEKTIAKLEKELENYQRNVAEHFEETADLVDDMTKSYKKVFDHLGQSARKLMTEEQIQKQLELRKGNKVTLEYLTESNETKLDDEDEINQNSEPEAEVEPKQVAKEELQKEDSIEDKEDSVEDNVVKNELIENESKETNEKFDDERETEINQEESDNEAIEQKITEENEEKIKEELDLEKEVETREKNLYN